MIEFKKEGLSVTSKVDFTEFDAGDDPILDAALEIKTALYYLMSDAIPRLNDQTGELPAIIIEKMFDIIGVDSIDEFFDFIRVVRLGEDPEENEWRPPALF